MLKMKAPKVFAFFHSTYLTGVFLSLFLTVSHGHGETKYIPESEFKEFKEFNFESEWSALNTQAQKAFGKNVVAYSYEVIDVPFEQIRQLEKRPLDVLKNLGNFSKVECDSSVCALETKKSDGVVTFKMSIDNLATKSGQISPQLKQLQDRNDQIIFLIYGFDWSHVFIETKSVFIFTRMNTQTSVRAIFLGAIKNKTLVKSKFVPFFNLEENILSNFNMEFSSLLRWLHPNKRMPQSESTEYFDDTYTQKELKLQDPEGDDALFTRLLRAGQRLFTYFFPIELKPLKSAPIESWQLVDPAQVKEEPIVDPSRPSVQGREIPLKIDALFESLVQVMDEELKQSGLRPQHSKPHEWSSEFRRKNPIAIFSKAFVSLSLGVTWRYMYTGKEQTLHQWLISQPFSSVTLHEIYRTSYRINKGDIYLSILTIQNLLSANWRMKNRESLPMIRRLALIVSGYNYDHDRFGTWYHFWGMVLYGYLTSSTKAFFVGRIEALGSSILYSSVKTQKQWMNIIGGSLGDLLKNVDAQKIDDITSHKVALDERHYRNLSEDFRDRLPFTETGDLSVAVQAILSDNMEVSLLPEVDAQNCTFEMIPRMGQTHDIRFAMTTTGLNLKAKQRTFVPLFNFSSNINWNRARVFLTCDNGIEFKAFVK